MRQQTLLNTFAAICLISAGCFVPDPPADAGDGSMDNSDMTTALQLSPIELKAGFTALTQGARLMNCSSVATSVWQQAFDGTISAKPNVNTAIKCPNRNDSHMMGCAYSSPKISIDPKYEKVRNWILEFNVNSTFYATVGAYSSRFDAFAVNVTDDAGTGAVTKFYLDGRTNSTMKNTSRISGMTQRIALNTVDIADKHIELFVYSECDYAIAAAGEPPAPAEFQISNIRLVPQPN